MVIVPKRSLKEIELSGGPLPLYSVTIHLSKTVRREAECKAQEAKQAARHPDRSARNLTTKADTTAATQAVTNSAVTVDSTNYFSSRGSTYK